MNEDAQLIVGRDAELGAISELLDALDGDASGLGLQVAGEPGIGKSRLLAQLCAGARERGHLVLSGRAAEFEGELPFGVFGDALDDWLEGLGSERLATLAGGHAAELAILFPAFEAVLAGRPPQLREERYRAYRAARGLLSSLAADAPLVLVLDDMHWADPGSLELACHLLAHPPRGPVLVALGFRPAQVSRTLSTALAAALRDPGATRLDLAPLSAMGAGDLLGGAVSDALRDQLYRESGGNPFFLLQLAIGQTLADHRRTTRGGDASTIPEPVRAALQSELSSLSAPALVLLQGAAVAGDPFEGMLAANAADLGEAEALELIDELLRFTLVNATHVPGRFAFRHPIVRASVYELAGAGWRARAHRRVAEVLSSRRASASALAPHVERSAIAGDVHAVALLVAAGAESAPRAPALAARWYGAALHLLPDTPDADRRRVELQIEMATALGASGQLAQSRGVLLEVLGRLGESDPQRAPAVAVCAGVEHLLGRHRDARARLTRAHELADQDSTAAIALKLELATGGIFEHRHEETLRWSELALEQATRLGERRLALVATGQMALAHYFLGRPVVELADRVGAAMDASDDADLATRPDLGLWVGWLETVQERYERAIEHCERLVDVARATGQGSFLMITVPALAQALMFVGRLDDAEEQLNVAIDAGRLAPDTNLAVAIGSSSVVATYKGRLDAAVRAGEESVQLASAMDPGQIRSISGLYLAMPLIEMRQPQRARDVLLATAGGAPDLADMPRSGRVQALEILTRAELMLGDVDAAERWARAAVQTSNGGELAIESAFAQRATAAVALARGDASGAAQIALDAAQRAGRAGGPAEAARCRMLAARALAQADRRSEAIAELQHAVEELGRVGAEGYRAEAEALLRGLGRRVARRPSGAATAQEVLRSLPEAERALADLVRVGHTNREIAALLFVSEKTVERRLSRIYERVGVSNRTALASLVVTDGAPARARPE
ncbi:MAG TPA: AAA family ATPase [Solirubrobacteraceae bacterium]|nr:AAA family ATPase [Solirubrobacteraceae bacterium]